MLNAAFPDLIASLAAIGRSMNERLDPRRFFEEFSEPIQRLVPHDRLVIALLDDDGRTFTVFAEHAAVGPVLHEEHYTIAFTPEARYNVREWTIGPVFAGEAILVDDFHGDPRFASLNPVEGEIGKAGFRSGLMVPLNSSGRVIGGLFATSLTPHTYSADHLAVARRVADLIGPFIENIVLIERERRRRERLRALSELPRVLGVSLNVRDVFARLADAVRPILNFDVMGVALFTVSGREVEILAEVNTAPREEGPWRMSLEDFSFAPKLRNAEPVLIRDATAELTADLPGDRVILADGGCSCLFAPLQFGEVVEGVIYFGKRRPYWFDRSDVEIATGISAQVGLAVQHQRLHEKQQKLSLAEGRAQKLEQRVASLKSELDDRYRFDRIIGRAPSLQEALARGAKVAPTETTVLITGESGTGKELVARAIHQSSLRNEGPFVAINCAALPDTLLESELFGHERGAFTGADRQKPGRFELAQGGTLFLDEVAELSQAVQAKLLRVLQEREFQRVGGTATLRADVRLIAATNRDLEQRVEAGQFRHDLLYRLNVFTVHLPPLRERGQDVLLLADYFVRLLGERMGKGEPGLSRDACDLLLAHSWPGNIRELQNAIERALIVSDGGLLTSAQLGITPRRERGVEPDRHGGPPVTTATPSSDSLPEWEKQMVLAALEKAKGNKSRAAKRLGLTRAQLYTRLKRFGLEA